MVSTGGELAYVAHFKPSGLGLLLLGHRMLFVPMLVLQPVS